MVLIELAKLFRREARYTSPSICNTPPLKEDDICSAFDMVMKKIGENGTTFSQEEWCKRVKSVIVHENRNLQFHLTDEREVHIVL